MAEIDPSKCNRCGLCQELCRFDAIHDLTVDSLFCEGCGFCAHACPADAITMKENLAGQLFVSETKYGPLVHARLGIAQENSGKLVAQVRQQAQQIVGEQGLDYIIVDGPPGIGCPVISTLSGVSLALLITEPTLSGIHDLKRVIEICQHFGVEAVACINKYDLNRENTRKLEEYCASQQVPVIARIPFDIVVTEALVKGVPVVNYTDGRVSEEIRNLWDIVSK